MQNFNQTLSTIPVLKQAYRNREAAEYLGLSPNTLNKWHDILKTATLI